MYQSNIIVDHIVNFTSQRDREVLAISLLKNINSLLFCSQTEIISINKKGDISSYISCDNNHYVVNEPTILIDDKLINAIEMTSYLISPIPTKKSTCHQYLKALLNIWVVGSIEKVYHYLHTN